MEFHGWQQYQKKEAGGIGILTLFPPSWDTISAIYSEVLKLVSKFPYRRRLVLYFVYRGTTVKLDLGDVKAAGVVCILGLGVGLGTLLVYRLYHQYIRPLFHQDNQGGDTDKGVASECRIRVDSSDSAVDGAMGNNSSQKTQSVFYSAQYGVALGGKGQSPNSQAKSGIDGVRMRRKGTPQKPMRRYLLDRDNTTVQSPDSSRYLYSDSSIRDSFYSTAESGFETLPECNEEEENDGNSLSQSLRDNYSPASLKERNERYFLSADADGLGFMPIGKDSINVSHADNAEQSSTPSVPTTNTVLSTASHLSAKSSPLYSGRKMPDPHVHSNTRVYTHPHSEDFDYDPSLDASESLCSFNSSADDWSWEEEDRDFMSPLPTTHGAMSDSQFRQSLMQRIHEWSTFADEYGKSRSPTPDSVRVSPLKVVRRSRSLDRHISESHLLPDMVEDISEPIKGEDTTTKNLECLETELQDIQGEFESITSRLHELIERGNKITAEESQQYSTKSISAHHQNTRSHTHSVFHRAKTRWERMPNAPHTESRWSSRASSVDYSWDCGEVGPSGDELLEAGGVSPNPPVLSASGDNQGLLTDSEKIPEGFAKDKVVSIGEAMNITDYAEQEWKGQTDKAQTIKQGYLAVPQLFHCHHIRRVRGDNYCALRCTLYQVLTAGYRVTQRWPGLISIVDRLHALHSDPASGLQDWTFASRLKWDNEDSKFSTICKCVLSLYATIEEISALQSQEEREARTLSLLNGCERFEVELMEGMKLMMLFRAVDLHHEMSQEEEVPTFAWLLFARDTSETVVDFVKNHINCVGDSAGVDQVEMCLLGHCLGVKLRVARLDHFGQEDFDCCFPDDAPGNWPDCYLLAEDDRHYNVPVA